MGVGETGVGETGVGEMVLTNPEYFINFYSLFQLLHIVLVTFCMSR